jgi:hypothetical protein
MSEVVVLVVAFVLVARLRRVVVFAFVVVFFVVFGVVAFRPLTFVLVSVLIVVSTSLTTGSAIVVIGSGAVVAVSVFTVFVIVSAVVASVPAISPFLALKAARLVAYLVAYFAIVILFLRFPIVISFVLGIQ